MQATNDEWGDLTRTAAFLWKRCTDKSGQHIGCDLLDELTFLTSDCAEDEVAEWLGKDPSKAYPHFCGPWGQNQEMAAYIGATWKALLWRSPGALELAGVESAEQLRALAEELITWGTKFQRRGLELEHSDEEELPELPLCDEVAWRVEQAWETDDPDAARGNLGFVGIGYFTQTPPGTHDYEPRMPPTGHAKSWDFFRNLGYFGIASCRAYELAEAMEFAAKAAEPTAKKARREERHD